MIFNYLNDDCIFNLIQVELMGYLEDWKPQYHEALNTLAIMATG